MTSIFENLQVDAAALPKVESLTFHNIEKRYLRVSLISAAIFWLLALGGAISISAFGDIENRTLAFIIGCGAVVSLAIANLFFIKASFKKKRYALRERDIIYTKGLWWSVRTSIPFNRIQHAELKQGPFERLYGLYNIKVYTAGGQSSDLVIPGLKEETAQSIKDFILGKTTEDGAGTED